MTRLECPRGWEIEAARDGRLTGEALDRLAGHLSRCEACAREARTLVALSGRLRSLPDPPLDDMSIRRLKGEVLRRVDAELAGRRVPRPWRRRAALAIGVAAVAALLFVLRTGGPRVVRPSEMTDPIVDVVESAGARWGSRTDGDTKRIDLERGTLDLHVVRHEGQRRLVVGTPDGDVIDMGTRFSVSVEDGRTERIGVEEGRVSFRPRGGSGVELQAGETWQAVPEPPPAASAARTSDAPAAEPAHTGAPASKARSRPTAAPVVSAADSDAAAEDAAYLSVLTLLHAGRTADARAAALGYLREFPHGFRAPELGRLVDAGPAQP